MSRDVHVKEIVTRGGKTKFKAEVWYANEFYTSKTFDSRALAVQFKKVKLEEAIRGTLKPAKARKKERITNADLDQSITFWATKYLADPSASDHGDERRKEYKLVGQRLAGRALRDFHGKDGALLITRIASDWKNDRQPRSPNSSGPYAKAPEPLKDQTVRLRLTALLRILRYARSELPDEVNFRVPDFKKDVFSFKLPPAHGNPRARVPDDAEYKKLLEHFGESSDFSNFLKVIDETGCRLGEVLWARNEDIEFFYRSGQIVGGCLTLTTHKTFHKTGKPRFVPLSRIAAKILAERILDTPGNTNLFSALGNNENVCKEFDKVCTHLGINDLQLKDFRRAFVNRNKGASSSLDLSQVMGDSSLLNAENATPEERAVQKALGHESLKTTAGYSTVEYRVLAATFTHSSRLASVLKMPVSNRQQSAREDGPAGNRVWSPASEFLTDFATDMEMKVTAKPSTPRSSSLLPIPSIADWELQA